MTPSRPASVTVALALVGGSLGSHGVAAGRASQQDVGDPACLPNALIRRHGSSTTRGRRPQFGSRLTVFLGLKE